MAFCSLDMYDKRIVSFMINGSISVLDLETQHYATIMRSHEENIDDICVLESNRLLVSCSGSEEVIKIWDESN